MQMPSRRMASFIGIVSAFGARLRQLRANSQRPILLKVFDRRESPCCL
jgi:hypothetical protein